MISNSEIRARARDVLGKGLFTAGWLYPVLVLIIISIISAALTGTYVGPMLVAGLLSVASAAYFIGRVRGTAQPQNLNAAVEGVSRNFLHSILTTLLADLLIFIGTLLFIIPGILLSYAFSMVYYVMNDHPELGPLDALKESHRLMKGHRWQLFCLQLSFFGWMLLGTLCLGVGALWASAYMSTANAVFYEELVNNDRGYFTVNEPVGEVNE